MPQWHATSACESVSFGRCDELNAVRTQTMLLGRMSAAERIVSFVRDLSKRFGKSDGSILLAMLEAGH